METTLIEKAKKTVEKFRYSKDEVVIKKISHLPPYIPAIVRMEDKIQIDIDISSGSSDVENLVAHKLGHVQFRETHKKLFYFIQAFDFPINFGLTRRWYIQLPYFAGLLTLGMAFSPTLLCSYTTAASICYFAGEYGANREANKRGFNLGWKYIF